MQRVITILKSGFFVLTLYFVVILAILIITEMPPVQADLSRQPVVTISDDVQYLRLTDAPPQRDISEQRFAPLEVRP